MTSRFSAAALPAGASRGSCGMEAPALRVLVVEKRQHPVPEAAFKVGESSVEIGAHYFQKRLGLEPHLRAAQLEKLGLRYFFTARRQPRHRAAGRARAAGVPAGAVVPARSRAPREHAARARTRELGATVLDDCRVRIDRARRRPASIACRSSSARRRARDHRAMGRRRQRPGRPAQAPARAASARARTPPTPRGGASARA